MSAGTGIRHSEYNPSETAPIHLLQIWITPRAPGGSPHYQELDFKETDRADRLKLLAAPKGGDGALEIRQEVRIYTARLTAGKNLPLPLTAKQGGWLQVVDGTLALAPGGVKLAPGDAAAIESETKLAVTAQAYAELLWFVFD
jgi:redox-sensitive bicupin YhaK (pirin superfamily)